MKSSFYPLVFAAGSRMAPWYVSVNMGLASVKGWKTQGAL